MSDLGVHLAHVRALARTNGPAAALTAVNRRGAESLCLPPETLLGPGVPDLRDTSVMGPVDAAAAVLVTSDGARIVALAPRPRPSYVDDLVVYEPDPQAKASYLDLPDGWLTEVELGRAALAAGVLRQALDYAAKILLTRAHPWHESLVDTADQDPHSQARFGQAFAVLAAVEALLSEAAPRASESIGDGAVADRVAVVRHYSQQRGGEALSDVIGVLGASSATTELGLDAHWRALQGLASAFPAPRLSLEGVSA